MIRALTAAILGFLLLPAAAAQPPLRVYISVDMEGIGGIAHSEMTSAAGAEYARGRRLMTEEVNAAIAGALAAGATDILVNDAHGSMRNLLVEELHPSARLISNNSKPYGMMEGISAEFDAVFFIGYHARAGNDEGLMAHTGTGTVADLRVNGVSVSEGGMNTALAGAFGVPVVLATGDEAFVAEIRELVDGIETVSVKRAIRRHTAELLPVERVRASVREAAERALGRRASIAPRPASEPVTVDLVYTSPDLADIAASIPCVERTGTRSVRFETESYPAAYKLIRVLYRNLTD